MRRKITSIFILVAMILTGFIVMLGGQAAAQGTYYLVEVPYEWDTDYGSPLNASND